MKTLPPRAVVVTRPTDYTAVLARHGTREQARFVLEGRGQSLDELWERHVAQDRALHTVLGAVPRHWRRAHVQRPQLDRFLFEPEDLVLAVGQDGLVANVAKYLRGQPVAGVHSTTGALVRHEPKRAEALMAAFEAGGLTTEARTLVQAQTDDGRRLLALNEIFIGHKSHQSARYTLQVGERRERHSSSGLIVATGTGATGWAQSIALNRRGCPALPDPASRELVYLVREAWASRQTGAELVHGLVAEDLSLVAEMDDGAVAFGDGIETDCLALTYGQRLTLSRAEQSLELVT
ncbi:MAG: NAD(+)/NADH kinase [Myxococcaceae bacterium]|nr:NAD(+)/NADH kinase [Myxococcaceae bacterium]